MFYSIIVTYYPDINHLLDMTREINNAGIGIIIYDNTPEKNSANEIRHEFKTAFGINYNILVLGDGNNIGLGSAFNKSIQQTRKNNQNVEGFIFFDQDSTVKEKQLASLTNEFKLLKIQGVNIGVLGAQPVDNKKNPYRVSASKNINLSIDNNKFHQASFVITSFSLVSVETLDKVGLFDEKLFIDLVDSEFSYRCSKFNLCNLISKSIFFQHEIGTSRDKFLGRKYSISAPIRNYYQARNLILVGRDYGWYYFIAKKLPIRFIQVILSGYKNKNIIIRLRYFMRGVYHGLMYKGGPYQ